MKELLGLGVLAWPLVLLVAILLGFVIAILFGVAYAKRHGKRAWLWAMLAFLVVFLPIFWDWIPTVVAHKYYCATEAGFWVYKTPEQWKKENPGVMETLVENETSITTKNAFVLNQRFNWVIKEERFFPLNYMIKHEQQVVDSKSGDVLARYIDFSTSHERREAGYAGWKFWLYHEHCSGGEQNQDAFGNFLKKFFGVKK